MVHKMDISEYGLQLIKDFEGCKLEAYVCSSGQLTIGFGHCGPDVHEGQTITSVEAKDLLAVDVAKFEEGISHLIKRKLKQSHFDALVSWAFNIGLGNVESSTLRRRMNQSQDQTIRIIEEELPRWNKGPDGPLEGLTRRRKAEVQLAQRGIYP